MTPAAVLSILVKTTGTQAAVGQMAKLDAASKAAGRSAGQLGAAQSRAQSALAATGGAAKKAAADVQRLGVAQRQAALRVEQAKIAEAAAIKKSGAESVQARRATLQLQAAELKLAATTDQLAAASKRQASAQAAMGTSAAGAGPKMQAAGRAAGYVALGVAAIGVASVKTAATYEQSMNKLQSVSQANADQMKRLSKLAVQLGADVGLPGTSAQDAAEAMTEMIKAGVSLDDTMSGVRSTLVLSAAAQVDNARAAEIASNALNTFKLKGKDLAYVADLLANTANASSVEIEDLAQGIEAAGSVFSAFQGPVVGAKGAIRDLNVALGILGNAGIKGAEAGTTIKSALVQLTGPSDKAKAAMRGLYLAALDNTVSQSKLTEVIRGTGKERQAAIKSIEGNNAALKKGGDIAYDASGKMRSFKDILRLVTLGTRDMTQEQKNAYLTQIFGSYGIKAIIALTQSGAKGWGKMTGAATRAGAAQDLANAKMKGFKGAIEGLKSTLETLAITLGTPLLGPLTAALRGFTSLLGSIDPGVLGAAIAGIGTLAASLWLVVKAQAAWNALAAANPVGLIIVGLVALGAALVIAYKKSEAFRNVVNGAWAAIKSGAASVVPAVVGAFNAVVAAVSSAMSAVVSEVKKWDVLFWVVKHAVGLMSAFLGPALALMGGAVKAWMAVTIAGFRAAWGVVRAIFSGAWIALKGIVTGGLTAMRGVIKIIGGIFKGDFGQIWDGIKDVFRGALRVVGSILRGSIKTLTGAGKAIGEGIMDALSGALSAGWGAVRGFVQKIVDVVNSVLGFFHLPKIPDVAGGSSTPDNGKAGQGTRAQGGTAVVKTVGHARGGAFARTGGWVNQPITLMGEEAPRFPEYVIPTNPAYRGRAKMLLAQAAGTIGFGGGGVNKAVDVANTVTDVGRVLTNPVGSLSQAIVGGGAKAGDFIRNLPNSKSLPDWIRGVGGQLTSKAKDWIKKKFADEALPDLGGGGGPAGTMDGHRVAGWILSILKRARADGVSFRVSDGYRDLAGQWAAFRNHGGMAGVRAGIVAYPGTSNHGGLKYPAGAVDISPGWENLVAWLAKHPNSPLHHYGNPRDPYHFSAKGNAKGGTFGLGPLARFAKGGTPIWNADAPPGTVNGLRGAGRKKQLAFMRKAWATVAPYFGLSGDSPMPATSFTHNFPLVGFAQDYGAKGRGYEGGRMYWPDWIWSGKGKLGQATALSLLVHEWAHAFQKKNLSDTDAEGGATLFARRVTPKVAAAMGLSYSQPFNQDQYVGEMKKAKKHGEKWIMRGQFAGPKEGGVYGHAATARSAAKQPMAKKSTAKKQIDISQFNHKFPQHTLGSLGGKARFNYDIVKRIAESVGLPGDLFAQIALGESGYYPGIWGTDPGGTHGYGLWAITADAWGGSPVLLKKYRELGGNEGMLNPFNNAKMAKFLLDHSPVKTPGRAGFPWYGTRYVGTSNKGPGTANLGRVSRTAGGNSGGAPKRKAPKGKPIKKLTKIPKKTATTFDSQKIWDSLSTTKGEKFYGINWALAQETPGLTDDFQAAAMGYFNAQKMVEMAAGFVRSGVPEAAEWLTTAQSARDTWAERYAGLRDANPSVAVPTSIPTVIRNAAESAYAAGKTATSSTQEDDNAWKDAIKQLAEDVRIQTLRGQAIERMQPADMMIAWMHELMNGRSGTSAALAAQNPSTPTVVAGGYR